MVLDRLWFATIGLSSGWPFLIRVITFLAQYFYWPTYESFCCEDWELYFWKYFSRWLTDEAASGLNCGTGR